MLSVARLAWPPGSQWGWAGPGTCVAGADISLSSFDSRVSRPGLVSTIAWPRGPWRDPVEPAKSGRAGWLHDSCGHLMGTPIRGTPGNAPFLIWGQRKTREAV